MAEDAVDACPIDVLSDEALALVLECVKPPLATLAVACAVCRRWAGIGVRLLAPEKRRAILADGADVDKRSAHAAVTRALALDSRPALARALDGGLVSVDDVLNVVYLVESLALATKVASSKRLPKGKAPARTAPEVGMRARTSDRFPQVDTGEFYETAEFDLIRVHPLPLVGWAAVYGSTACMDLLIERGARLTEREILAIVEHTLAERAWMRVDIIVGACEWASYAEAYGIACDSRSGVFVFDPEPAVARLLALLPQSDQARTVRGATHPLLVLAHAAYRATVFYSRFSDRDDYTHYDGYVFDCADPERIAAIRATHGRIMDSVDRLVALLVRAGYTPDATHRFGFTPYSDIMRRAIESGIDMETLERMSVRDLLACAGPRIWREAQTVFARVLTTIDRAHP
jgi:hypothetical protein